MKAHGAAGDGAGLGQDRGQAVGEDQREQGDVDAAQAQGRQADQEGHDDHGRQAADDHGSPRRPAQLLGDDARGVSAHGEKPDVAQGGDAGDPHQEVPVGRHRRPDEKENHDVHDIHVAMHQRVDGDAGQPHTHGDVLPVQHGYSVLPPMRPWGRSSRMIRNMKNQTGHTHMEPR